MVPNPGFELFTECPTSIAQFKYTKFWFSGNTGTPEYLRNDCPFDMGKAHSGKGYSGAIFYGHYPKAIEYLMVELNEILRKDSTYCLSFWIRAEESFIYVDQIGLHLSIENLKLNMWAPVYLKPVLKSKYNQPIIPQLGWTQIKGEYKSKGSERFLTIGNFTKPDRHIQHVDEFYSSFESGWNSYYFIDDVEVKEKTKNEGCMSKPVPKEIASVETKMPLVMTSIVYFGSDKSIPNKIENERLLSFIDSLETCMTKTMELIGHTDSIGSGTYNIELSKLRILQIQEIVLSKWSVTPTFKLNYFGESKPIYINKTEKGRAQNRRVEIKVVCDDRKGK